MVKFYNSNRQLSCKFFVSINIGWMNKTILPNVDGTRKNRSPCSCVNKKFATFCSATLTLNVDEMWKCQKRWYKEWSELATLWLQFTPFHEIETRLCECEFIELSFSFLHLLQSDGFIILLMSAYCLNCRRLGCIAERETRVSSPP